MLLAGEVDVSLLRVEEAIALSLDGSNTLHTLLGFSELKQLVPIQPHGVLAAREDYVASHQEELSRLTRGMIAASRLLNDDYGAFAKVYRHYVKVVVPEERVKAIWEQERSANGFALNGELSLEHWQKQIDLFYELNPSLRRVTFEGLIDSNFVRSALQSIGVR